MTNFTQIEIHTDYTITKCKAEWKDSKAQYKAVLSHVGCEFIGLHTIQPSKHINLVTKNILCLYVNPYISHADHIQRQTNVNLHRHKCKSQCQGVVLHIPYKFHCISSNSPS